jgi:hypothetical protein
MKTKEKKLIVYLVSILICFSLSACGYNNTGSSTSENKNNNSLNNEVNDQASTDTDSVTPFLNNESPVDVPIQQIYKNEQEAANFQLHMSSVDDSLKEASDDNTNK